MDPRKTYVYGSIQRGPLTRLWYRLVTSRLPSHRPVVQAVRYSVGREEDGGWPIDLTVFDRGSAASISLDYGEAVQMAELLLNRSLREQK